MEIVIAAVGRLRGAEADLVAGYLERASQAGRPLGLGPATLVEVDDRRQRDPGAQAARLLALSDGAFRIALDERGRRLDSPGLARRLATLRDDGVRRVACLVGGADGHGPAVGTAADLALSFGPMVWPHALVRVMLAEQIYRATQILAGTPYHRA